MKKIWLGLLFIFSFGAISASAQIMSNPSQWYINNQMYSMRAFNSIIANSRLRKGAGKNARPASPKSAGKTSAPVDYTVFKESPAGSLLKRLTAQSAGQNSREAEQMYNSLIAMYKQTAAKDHFPANDLAYAFNYFIVGNYHIYHDLLDVPLEKDPRARKAKDGFERIEIMSNKRLEQISVFQERVVYNQFKQILAENPEIQKMTDAQKQEAAELLAMMAGVNFAAYLKGINDENEKLAEEARRMAKDGLEKLLGAPIDQIKIGNSGVEVN